MSVGLHNEPPHTMVPELSNTEVQKLIGLYDGYDRDGSVAVDYHQDGVVLYNYDTNQNVIFTFEQIKTVIKFLDLRIQWYEEYLERQRNNPSST